jgi:hypothetical protein
MGPSVEEHNFTTRVSVSTPKNEGIPTVSRSARHAYWQGHGNELIEYIAVSCSRHSMSRLCCHVSPLHKSMVIKPVDSHHVGDHLALPVVTNVEPTTRARNPVAPAEVDARYPATVISFSAEYH